MEEIKIILDAMKGLSGPAVYIGMGTITLLFAYKVAVIGSIYGVVKYAITSVKQILTVRAEPKPEMVDVTYKFKALTIDAELDYLISQLHRLTPKNSKFLHRSSIDRLKRLIDADEEGETE